MLPISEALWERPDFWLVMVLPLLGMAIGGAGNWLSLRILFGRLPAAGIDRGILAARTREVAARVATILAPSFRLSELFRMMQPEKVADHVSDSVMGRLDEYVDDVMTARHAVLWANLPQVLRQRIYARVGRQLPSIMDNLMEDMAENVEELVDLSHLLDGFATSHPDALPSFLEQVLEEEGRFLIRAGMWSGLVLGALQAMLYVLHPASLVLVISAAILALGVLVLPRALLLARWPGSESGLSPWLQSGRVQLTRQLSRSLVDEVLSLRHLMQRMMNGGKAARARSMIRRHMRPLLDAGLVRTTLQMLLGVEGYAQIKHQVVEKAVASTAELLADADFNQERAATMQATCDERLAALPPESLRDFVQAVLDEGLYPRLALMTGIGTVAGFFEVLLVHVLQG
jgi:uncharacterized membrane protein YheB (UPF0754 family)